MTELPVATVFIVGALVLPLLPSSVRRFFFIAVPVAGFALLLQQQPDTSLTVPFLEYELVVNRVDRLSLVFGYIFTIVTFLGGIYAFHLRDVGEQVAALLYAGCSLGVVFAGDLFTLFVFWEFMAVASVYLVWARRTAESRGAGMRYLMVHLFGGSVLLAGILLHWGETGSFAFTLMEGGLGAWLILIAFTLNAAVPPLHAWLPDAYPAATVTGAVFMSAFTTKTAVYALARGFAGWELLLWAGVIMALYGVAFAVLENDIRRLLAYHIVSQVGYMVAGVGLGTEMAINGVTAHAFCHILYKALLFMGAGAVLYTVGTSKLTELGGLAKAMPVTFALYMVGGFSISGVPLFNGFISKSMIVSAAEVNHEYVAFLLLTMASIGTFLHTGLKLPYFTWFGPQRSLQPARVPTGMHVGMGLTAALCVAIGVFPTLLYQQLPFAVDYRPYTIPHVVQTVQLLAFTALAFFLLRSWLGGEAKITLDTDWVYRRGVGPAYAIGVAAPAWIFTQSDRLATAFVHRLARVAANPTGHLLDLQNALRRATSGTLREAGVLPAFDPDVYRPPVAAVILVILLFFAVLASLNLCGAMPR